jgi:hypothetical protein
LYIGSLVGTDPIGKQLLIDGGPNERARQIGGVIENVRQNGLDKNSDPEILVSYLQQASMSPPHGDQNRLDMTLVHGQLWSQPPWSRSRPQDSRKLRVGTGGFADLILARDDNLRPRSSQISWRRRTWSISAAGLSGPSAGCAARSRTSQPTAPRGRLQAGRW